MSKDLLIKALAFSNQVRIYSVSTTQTVKKAQSIHQTYPTASAALGRTLTMGSLMSATLKQGESVTLRIDGGGDIGAIVVDGNDQSQVRGYVTNPSVHFQKESGKLDVGKAVGTTGSLHVTKDLNMRDMFTSSVPLQTGEIGDDFTYYFTASEQIPSAVALGVLVNPDNSIRAAGGFLVQILPGCHDDVLDVLERNLALLKPISTLIAEGHTPLDVIKLIAGNDYTLLSEQDVSFQCQCSKDRFARGLAAIQPADLEEMILEDHGAEAVCHFCKTTYYFDEDDLRALQKKQEQS